MVVQVVRVSIKPEQRDRWLEIARANVERTRAEEGNERMQIAEDLEQPNNFVLVETWRDMDAVYGHFRDPEFGQMMGALQEIFAGPPEVEIHEVSSTMSMEDAMAAAGAAS